FQSARISLPARVSNESLLASGQAAVGGEEVTDQKVLMDLLEPYQPALSAQLFRPWPAPLPHRLSLADLYQRNDMPARHDVPSHNGEAPPRASTRVPSLLYTSPAPTE